MSPRIEAARSEQLFVGSEADPRQVVRVRIAGEPGPVRVALAFDEPGTAGGDVTADLDGEPVLVEIPFTTGAAVGTVLSATVTATGPDGTAATRPVDVTVAEPGWTMYLVSHFHYDPVWWNTQAAYTATWDVRDEPGAPRRLFHQHGHTGFSLVRTHLELARRDPEYRFVLAEVDYLKPYWDAFPADRALLRDLIRTGRVELMGGTYNEPNTNLTSAECTARNFVYGTGFQHGVLGAEPATAWQLDAFGHDPQFAGMAADAGITSSAWARGPYHQWGPMLTRWADREPPGASAMQFPSEFCWLSPSGRGVLTHYMPNHYSAGWALESATTLGDAAEAAYRLFQALRPVALTRNVLLPVGTDYAPPNTWLMELHRFWRTRYVWPRFVCGLPREFFAAVRAELAATGRTAPPQTRDMNPVYTGKDVSYVDTKQANRAAEELLVEAETWATLARLQTGRPYDGAVLDRAWRLLVYGAHHDAITGSESDQVYVDLLTGWREAYDLARRTRDAATESIADELDSAGLAVFNSLNTDRADMVSTPYRGLVPTGDDGEPLPCVVADGVLTFRAPEVPGVGHRTVPMMPGEPAGWRTAEGLSIGNGHYRVRVDPARGGAVDSLVRADRELLAPGRVGNELLVYDEYPEHPDFGEGPWHLLPKGPPVGSAGRPASVRRETSPVGERLIVDGEVAGVRYRQTLTLWHGVDRLDCATTIHEYDAADRLIRVRWPCPVPGALPVSEVGNAVVGRGFGLVDVDTAEHPWTLDNPAHRWFGLSAAARIRVTDPAGQPVGERAIGVAELVFSDWDAAGRLGGDLAKALARHGVTATCAVADGPRYGDLAVDSNLPDVRISVGDHGFTDAVLGAAAPECNRVLVPARKPLAEVWQPSADLTAADTLPVLVVTGADLAAEVAALVADLADGVIEVTGPAVGEPLEDRTVALFNRGLPGFAVDPSGALHLSLLRSCTGWPSGIWIDPPKRTAPDGSAFQEMHWSHTFEYAFVAGSGDWRALDLSPRAAGYNRPLHAVPVAGSGSLPGTARLLEVAPAGRVLLTALKAHGNPLAAGLAEPDDPVAAGVTVRCYETTGSPVRVRVTAPVPLTAPRTTDLLERPLADPGDPGTAASADGAVECHVGGAGILTVTARPVAPAPQRESTARPREPAQPVFTRYWLHNTGPAPLGNQPVAVFVSPERLVSDGEPVTVSVTVSSELVDQPVEADVELRGPDGWAVEPAVRPVRLAPGGFSIFDATVRPAPGAAPGEHFLSAGIRYAGQAYQDVATIRVPGAEPTAEALTVALGADEVTVVAGERTSLPVRLVNHARGEIRGELAPVSPYGTWDWVHPGVRGFAVPAGGAEDVAVEIAPPPDTPAGTSWLLVRVGWFGRLCYSPAVRLRVVR